MSQKDRIFCEYSSRNGWSVQSLYENLRGIWKAFHFIYTEAVETVVHMGAEDFVKKVIIMTTVCSYRERNFKDVEDYSIAQKNNADISAVMLYRKFWNQDGKYRVKPKL